METLTHDEPSSSKNSYIEAIDQHPFFKHPFHPPHPLVRQSSPKKIWCDSCHKSFKNEPYYSCSDQCDFAMDLKCLFMDPIELCEGQAHIQHVSHQHPMPLVNISPSDQVVCFACQSPCLGTTPVYACAACDYFLHKRCAECPFSFDDGTTFLKIDHKKQIRCCCCRRNVCFFVLRCDIYCDYPGYTCIDCYMLPKHLNHYNLHSVHDCSILSKLIDPYLSRLPQLFNQYLPRLLSKCLSKLLNQYGRPNLTLSILNCVLCHVFFKNIGFVPQYKCTACGFIIDVESALTPPIILQGQEYSRHFNHPHPMIRLVFLEKDDGDEEVDEYCSACNSPCSGLVYSCIKCKYFLHKSCAQLPLRFITHPLHKHSFLTQLPHSTKLGTELICSLCYKEDCGFFFQCGCKFTICGRCILETPYIKYEGHEPHFFCLVENVHSKSLECNAYDDFCKLPVASVELCSTESTMFRCVDCDNFNLHFLCGPLPRIIKFKYHIHSLILVDSVTEDDSDEYYCDICESERDPRICVYYCQDCKYSAHVHCLKSEVISVLKGDLRDVELKTVKIHNNPEKEEHKVASRGYRSELKINDIIDKLPKNEAIVLLCELNWPFRPQIYLEWKNDTINFRNQILLSRFNREYFEKFMDWLDGFCYLESLKLDGKFSFEGEIVVVEGYMVYRTFARILILLLRKHGDVSSDSRSTLEMKSITFCFLCQVLDSMRRTRVRDITKDHLKEWYFYVKYAQNRGFKIQFMFDHLTDVVRTFIALQPINSEVISLFIHRSYVQDRNIQQIQQQQAFYLKSHSDSNFIKSGEFYIDSLNIALIKLGIDNYVAKNLL